ncbi:unnamed protein product [Albugo candida]|uniref:Uncharacterized protein n=1 Tax=Albugo candida TaxID=65357 RepID=A0A024G7J6_9STRA|nr:unnamed protein product [Albugo candida]|eukprot:CCI42836.1 unnamed protein product [Albugo candida]
MHSQAFRPLCENKSLQSLCCICIPLVHTFDTVCYLFDSFSNNHSSSVINGHFSSMSLIQSFLITLKITRSLAENRFLDYKTLISSREEYGVKMSLPERFTFSLVSSSSEVDTLFVSSSLLSPSAISIRGSIESVSPSSLESRQDDSNIGVAAKLSVGFSPEQVIFTSSSWSSSSEPRCSITSVGSISH